MGFVKRVCKICGHDTQSMVGCNRDGCAKADDSKITDLRQAIHDHCAHEDEHGLCTQVGCMGEAVPLGLVNPPIDGSAPAEGEHPAIDGLAVPSKVGGGYMPEFTAQLKLEPPDEQTVHDVFAGTMSEQEVPVRLRGFRGREGDLIGTAKIDPPDERGEVIAHLDVAPEQVPGAGEGAYSVDPTPAATRGLDLDALAVACRDYLEVHDDDFENDLSPYGPAVERLRDLLQSRIESQD